MCNCICVCQTNSALALADDLDFDFAKELAEFSQLISADIGSIESINSHQFFDDLLSFDSNFCDFDDFGDLQVDFVEKRATAPQAQPALAATTSQVFDPVKLLQEDCRCDC
ncbi:MAG: hypothetical protein SAL07_25225 [Oscillatoria sp. PMC 1051.18]|nr:hypothetical protein [Oscillatoria sp. PMC 1050.18]MEC5033209.1 hypothetical protein [Oscillatoria sp. PMC 1051.18]